MRSYHELKQILELWEQGHNKLNISKITGIPRWTVRDCIDRYGTVAHLDAFMAGTLPSLEKPAEKETRRYTVSYSPRPRGYSDEDIVTAVAEATSLAEVLRKFDIRPSGGNYDTIKRKIKELGLDTSHFTGSNWLKGKKNHAIRHRALEEILVEDSTYVSTNNLRKRLLSEGIFEHRCLSCGLAEWLQHPIPLEIDHINGDRRDNRLENLRLLCPNCHALTTTYRGKNKKAAPGTL